MYEKILVPLDGSELAEVALPYVEELAGKLGSEIILLSVAESAEAQDYHRRQVFIGKITGATKHRAERYLSKPEGKSTGGSQDSPVVYSTALSLSTG